MRIRIFYEVLIVFFQAILNILASLKNIEFDGLLAAGGFEGSASRKNGKMPSIHIKRNADESCVLKTDLVFYKIKGVGKSVSTKLKDGKIRINLKKDKEVFLYAKGVEKGVIRPVETKPEAYNSYELNQ